WEKLCADHSFAQRVAHDNRCGSVAWWDYQQLDAAIPVAQQCPSYLVFAVDGSQIYPDRHQGLSCFVINIGSVVLSYGALQQSVQLRSFPYLFTGYDQKQE